MRDRSVLASEQSLELQSDGRGWARNIVNRLCIDLAGRVSEPCTRDNVKESYLTPIDHPITVRLTGAVPVGATCAWSFDDGDGPQQSTFDCAEPVNLRVRYGRQTVATVDVSSGHEAPQKISTEIRVRDMLIAGLGDSVASGEGNPDRPIALADEGFCFRYYLGSAAAQYYRPSRAGYKGGRACEAPDTLQNWQRHGALWFNSACHRSLYSYQTRTALALAVRISAHRGDLSAARLHRRHHRRRPVRQPARARMPADQVDRELPGRRQRPACRIARRLTAAKRRQPDRKLDLVLLSIGANDIYFSGLVADVIVDTATERALFRRSGVMASVDDSRTALARDLPQGFGKLRDALKPLVGGDLSRVVYTSYANPALSNGGAPCPGGRAGFDIHPSFNADPQRLADVAGFVQNEFLPQLKALATVPVRRAVPRSGRRSHDLRRCASGGLRRSRFLRARGRRSANSTAQCFSPKGESFDPDIVNRRQPADAVRPQRRRIPRLSAARALDPRRQ